MKFAFFVDYNMNCFGFKALIQVNENNGGFFKNWQPERDNNPVSFNVFGKGQFVTKTGFNFFPSSWMWKIVDPGYGIGSFKFILNGQEITQGHEVQIDNDLIIEYLKTESMELEIATAHDLETLEAQTFPAFEEISVIKTEYSKTVIKGFVTQEITDLQTGEEYSGRYSLNVRYNRFDFLMKNRQ